MDTPKNSSMRVLRLPELFNAIVQYLDRKNIHTLRLVNTLILDQCSPHFSITLDLERKSRYPNLKKLAESALAIEEGAAMASTGRTAETGRKQSSPLDQIQGLRIIQGYSLRSSLTPEIVSILNQCGNLRHIDIKAGSTGITAYPEKQSYPAGLIWSSMFPEDQGGRRRRGGDGGGGGGGCGCEDEQHHWTFWDLLPLEGSLFDRLESLKIEMSCNTELNLDRFIPRLGYSGAAKTLRALTMITLSNTKKVSWEIFQDCICNLSVLKTLHMHLIEIIYTKDFLIDSDDGSQHKMETQLQHVAPTVNSLKCQLANCKDPNITLAFMGLFPNLESLELFGLDSLLGKAVEERIYSEVGHQLPLQQSPWTQQHSTGSAECNGSPHQ
ncbi:hypothetical protein BGX24_002529, partial [Mortierella sp. AD032]